MKSDIQSNPVPSPIIRFLSKQHTLSFATAVNNTPYSCNCFYVYLDKYNLLVFKSEEQTKHILDAIKNPTVGGTIYNTKGGIHKIRGVQYTGAFSVVDDKHIKEAATLYYKTFPFGKLVEAPFWNIHLEYIKMTDNKWGIGKKLEWRK